MVSKFTLVFSFLVLSPVVVLAIVEPNPCDVGVGKIICPIQDILNAIVPVLVALGVVYFVWGVVTYVIADGEEAKKAGRDRMIFGIIGFAVIIGLWGLVSIITNTFAIDPDNGGSSAPTTDQLKKLLPQQSQ